MSTASLGGFPCIGSSKVSWVFTRGVEPSINYFDMDPKDANILYRECVEGKRPTTLVLRNELRGKPETISNLWVLRVMPGENPNLARVAVADRRWMWSYAWVGKDFNMRRQTGVKRAVASDQPANNPVVPDYQYQLWSLKNLQPPPQGKWQPHEVLHDVFNLVFQIEKEHHGSQPPLIITPGVGSKIKALPVEDLSIHDQGDVALLRTLERFADADVTVDAQGKVIVYSRTDPMDGQIVKALGAEKMGHGHIAFVSNAALRPKHIEVYFMIAAEIRTWFRENGSAVGSTVVEGVDDRHMDNVAPVPDYQLPVPPAQGEHCQGTYLTFDQLFNLWGNLPNPFGGATRQLDHDLVRKAFMPFMDLWAKLGLMGVTDPDNDWPPRLAVTQGHYRRTFRLGSRLRDRMRSLEAYRIATIDRVSGQRAPAMAYSDYSVFNSVRSIFKNRSQNVDLRYILNQSGWSSVLDSSAKPSPAIVHLVDHDQGIFHLEYYDPFGVYSVFFPSKVEESTMPNGDLTKKGTNWISFDAVADPSQPLPSLSSEFKCDLLFTAVPGAPNGLERYFKIKVEPGDVTDLLPYPKGAAGALGPPMRIFVGPGVERARVQWLDSRAEDIERLFGLKPGVPNLTGLVMNEGDKGDAGKSPGGGAASLWGIAKAEAVKVYCRLIDRYMGEAAGDFTPGLLPLGHIQSVEHEVDTQGGMSTRLKLPEDLPAFPLEAFLSSDTRAILLRQVLPG